MSNYTYYKTSSVTLSYIKASPNNIILTDIDSNVTNTGIYGINGGFFSGSNLVSIAVNNDVPVQGIRNEYGSGWFNEKYDRGTLVWDKKKGAYSVQIVASADNIHVADRSAYWAQGGVSMSLQNDKAWFDQAKIENMPNITGKTTRTGLVYSSGMNVWLVVTDCNCTAEEFRAAIKSQIGSGTIVDGVFLDGGGSSQLNCLETKIKGDGRLVRQMVALISK